MSTQQGEPNMESFLARLAALEQLNARMREELAALQAERSASGSATMAERAAGLSQQVQDALAVGKAVEAAVTLAPTPQGPAAFTSSDGTTPAVSATGNPNIGVFASGTSGANSSGNFVSGFGVYAQGTSGTDGSGAVVPAYGLYATSDNGAAVFGVGTKGPGVQATSNTGPSIHAQGSGGSGASPTLAAVFAEGGAGTAVYGHATGSGTGVVGDSDAGVAIQGTSTSGTAVLAQSTSGPSVHAVGSGSSPTLAAVFAEGGTGTGIYGHATGSGTGVVADSDTGNAVQGTSTSGIGVSGNSSNGAGVYGQSNGGYGVQGQSTSNTGVYGASTSNTGVYGASTSNPGVHGQSNSSYGVWGNSSSSVGVAGSSSSGVGVQGTSTSGTAVLAQSTSGPSVHAVGSGGSGSSPTLAAVFAEGGTGTSVYGHATGSGTGVVADSDTGIGVHGHATGVAFPFPWRVQGIGVLGDSELGIGVQGTSTSGTAMLGMAGAGHLAGEFIGEVYVSGNLIKAGGGFKIDHPLDPANKFLAHSFVESPERKNVYDGVVTLDAHGEAVVELPAWFEALNQEFRYQLTSLGAPGPDLYIAEEISNQRFKIAGGAPAMRICWLVTGSRNDAWAQANQLVVEQEKPAEQREHYLHPELYGYSLERSIAWVRHPETLRQFMEAQQTTPE